MRLSDLPLLTAIKKVTLEIENPGAEHWTTNDEKRRELCRMVKEKMAPDIEQQIIDMFVRYRKSGTIGKQKKLELLVEVAETHGAKCFYANRGQGDCADDVDLDRILPGSRGGQYTVENCMLACSYHNRSRGDQNVEEYLTGGC